MLFFAVSVDYIHRNVRLELQLLDILVWSPAMDTNLKNGQVWVQRQRIAYGLRLEYIQKCIVKK